MIPAIGLGLLAGLLLGNGLPHFFKGVTGDRYPTVFGSGPVPNLLAGWSSLVLAAVAIAGADVPAEPLAAGAAVAVGLLAMGLFHARGLAFGRE